MMPLIAEGARVDGVVAVCAALAVARATYYRHARPVHTAPLPRRVPRALTSDDRRAVLDTLNEDRFADQAPREVYATLLDEGRYLCSISTMYRLLAASGALRERRDQLVHPEYKKPELLATGPNQVWSWDITKLRGPVKWTYYHLYVLLDIFSRYVTGWMVATVESARLAAQLVEESCAKQGILPGTLKLHADRGTSMKSKTLAQKLTDLSVEKSHSRPHVSNDNPYSEAQFKTLKYRPGYPDRFGGIEDARAFCRPFFAWYNAEHRHSGLGLLTPEVVHYGRASDVLAARQLVLTAAWEANPERFVRRAPFAGRPPQAAWINPPPADRIATEEKSQ